MKPTKKQLDIIESLTRPPRCSVEARQALRALLADYRARGEALRAISEYDGDAKILRAAALKALEDAGDV